MTLDKKTHQKLACWIDNQLIADLILEALDEHRERQILRNAKKVWLDVLECELSRVIERTIDALQKRNELK